MKHTTRLLLVAAIAFGMIGAVSAQAAEDNSTVSVEVGFKTAIDITPSFLDFGTVEPGTSKTQATMEDGDIATHVEIENIGSSNITNIWMNASTPASNPFGSGNAEAYNAGNFMQISPTGEIAGVSSSDSFTFVNRKEFNETNDLSYIFTPEDGGDWRYGRFRAGSQEFFWAVNTTGAGSCTTTSGTSFRVGDSAHNQTATGSNDFTDTTNEVTTYSLSDVGTAGGDYLAPGVWINSSSENFQRQYDVVVNCGDPTWAARTHYNVDFGEATDLATNGQFSEYVLTGGNNTANSLKPGQHFSVNMSMEVPLGVAQGSINDGYLRVLANLQ